MKPHFVTAVNVPDICLLSIYQVILVNFPEDIINFCAGRKSFEYVDAATYECIVQPTGTNSLIRGASCASYNGRIAVIRSDIITYIAKRRESSVHGKRLINRKRHYDVVHVERVVRRLNAMLLIVFVLREQSEINHHRLRFSLSHCSRIHDVEGSRITSGYSYSSHRSVVHSALLRDVSYSEH